MHLFRWGNGLGLRLSDELISHLDPKEGDEINVRATPSGELENIENARREKGADHYSPPSAGIRAWSQYLVN